MMTQKRKPSYELEAIKQAFENPEDLNATKSAIKGAAAIGYGRSEIVEVIQSMTRHHFHKSMTAYRNHRIWQDVYFVPSEKGYLYVKFSAGVLCEFVLVSFKEKDGE